MNGAFCIKRLAQAGSGADLLWGPFAVVSSPPRSTRPSFPQGRGGMNSVLCPLLCLGRGNGCSFHSISRGVCAWPLVGPPRVFMESEPGEESLQWQGRAWHCGGQSSTTQGAVFPSPAPAPRGWLEAALSPPTPWEPLAGRGRASEERLPPSSASVTPN